MMKCHHCGACYENTLSDLPFKIGPHAIVIIKDIPVLQCSNCHEYLLEDSVIEAVDKLLERIDDHAEVEILRYAA
jgi:YgiT-type zinc finger domain-containing protein